MPDELKAAILKEYKGYRLPRQSDNLEEDIDFNKRRGGDGCLGVAPADFNDDSCRDYGVLIAAVDGDHTLLVAAMCSGDEWKFDRLRTWSGERNRLFAAVADPGRYDRSESLDYPPAEPNEQESIESSFPGIVTGRTESSGIYYFWTPDGWSHVWAIN